MRPPRFRVDSGSTTTACATLFEDDPLQPSVQHGDAANVARTVVGDTGAPDDGLTRSLDANRLHDADAAVAEDDATDTRIVYAFLHQHKVAGAGLADRRLDGLAGGLPACAVAVVIGPRGVGVPDRRLSAARGGIAQVGDGRQISVE